MARVTSAAMMRVAHQGVLVCTCSHSNAVMVKETGRVDRSQSSHGDEAADSKDPNVAAAVGLISAADVDVGDEETEGVISSIGKAAE